MEHPAIVVALALAPCGLLLYYYLRQLRQAPEPWIRVATVCAIGGATFFVAVKLQNTLKDQVPFSTESWAWAVLVIALTEEILKISAVLIAGPRPRRYARMSSGLIYGVAAGLGFAAVENIVYVQSGGASTAVLRAVTAVPCHALSSAIVGTALGGYHRIESPWRASRSVLLNLLVAICLHGLYDGLILTGGQFRVAIVPLIALEAILVHFILRRARQMRSHLQPM